MREIGYRDMSKEALKQLERGAFLVTGQGEAVNVMTIAWGNIGYMWKKPIFTVMVRPSRYTYDLIDKSDSFTVSIPINGDQQKALGYCGTMSGRDVNKVKDCHFTLKDGVNVSNPMILECTLHYECKIVAKQDLNEQDLSAEINAEAYEGGNYHRLYYGEILAVYVTDPIL